MTAIKEEIEGSKLFLSMDNEQILRFLECSKPLIRSFSAKEIILEQGEPQKELLIFLEGSAELYKNDFDGNRSLVGILSPRDLYGQLAIFGNDNRSPFTVEAVEECRVMYIGKDLFYRPCSNVCPTHQRLIQNMLALLANQAALLDKKIEYLTTKSLRKKIARYLLEESAKNQDADLFEIPLNREALAEYFDVQRPSLSREMTRMKEERIIDFHRRTFRLLDREALRRYAN